MKRVIAVFLLVSSLVLVPASATAQAADVNHVFGQTSVASAYFQSPDSSGCVYTYVTIVGAKGKIFDKSTGHQMTQDVFVNIEKTDFCAGNLMMWAWNDTSNQPMQLEVDPNGKSASLNATVSLVDHVTGEVFDVNVAVNWSNDGLFQGGHYTQQTLAPGLRIVEHGLGWQQQGTASGTVLDARTGDNYTPTPSEPYSSYGRSKEGDLTIERQDLPSLALAPTSAATQTRHVFSHHITDTANAYANFDSFDSTGCIETIVSVNAYDGKIFDKDTGRETTQSLDVSIAKTDYCAGNWMNAYSEPLNQPMQLKVDRIGGYASLQATVPMRDNATGEVFDVNVALNWIGDGPYYHSESAYQVRMAGWHEILHGNGWGQQAAASGTVLDARTGDNYTPTPDPWGNFGYYTWADLAMMMKH